jgi:hypothetical protein
VRADGKGYTHAGESVDGFADRPELPQTLRVRLARLGERYAPERLSSVQRELLASPLAKRDASRQPSAALDGAQLKNELLDRIAGRPDPSDEALATEIVQRRRS